MARFTQKELRDLLLYEPETGIFTWQCRPARKIHIGDVAGCRTSYGYITIAISGFHYRAHRLAWFYTTGQWPPDQIDHINGKRDDNRFSNLRLATLKENNRNVARKKTNASGHKGVYWHKAARKWAASIVVDRNNKHLGLFNDIEDAAAAYVDAAKQHFGEFAREQ